jgi:hypothetical protein
VCKELLCALGEVADDSAGVDREPQITSELARYEMMQPAYCGWPLPRVQESHLCSCVA